MTLGVLLMVAALATCQLGVDHEIAKIPAEQRAGMSDTDWIGAEWIFRGMAIGAAGAAVLVVALVLRARRRT